MNHEMPPAIPNHGGLYILLPPKIGGARGPLWGTRGFLWGLGAGGVGGRKFYSCRRSNVEVSRCDQVNPMTD
jgi:hypothetical protein